MTYDDLKELFKDMLSAEETARDIYLELSKETKDERLKKIFEAIMKDEIRHAKNVKEALGILDSLK